MVEVEVEVAGGRNFKWGKLEGGRKVGDERTTC